MTQPSQLVSSPQPSADKAGQIKILIVDDSLSMRQALELILKDDFTIQTAGDGQEAIERYASFAPDVILLDVVMPVADGYQVIKHIRKAINDQDTFILMLTAEESQQSKLKALNLGANDFLYKPFDRTELLARIGVAERQVRLTRKLRSHMERIQTELELVALLQSKLLPHQSPYFQGVSVQNLYRPSGQASGDYFDYFLVDSKTLRIVIADVSGHGARAAFLMAIVRTLFRITETDYKGLDATLALVNHHLNQIIGNESDFVTAFAADIDLQNNCLYYLNCGHPPGLLRLPGDKFVALKTQTTLLGFFEQNFSQERVDFPNGSELFLFTDGFYEWQPVPGTYLDLDGFWELAKKAMMQPGNLLENVMRDLSAISHSIPKFKDDLTALWVKVEARC